MFLYFGSLSATFMNLIQVFWFASVGLADRIAKSPL
jgi:hypothetical protein